MKKALALLTAWTLTAVAWGSGTVVTWNDYYVSDEWDGATAYLWVVYGDDCDGSDIALNTYLYNNLDWDSYDPTTGSYSSSDTVDNFVAYLETSEYVLTSTKVSSGTATYTSAVSENALFSLSYYNDESVSKISSAIFTFLVSGDSVYWNLNNMSFDANESMDENLIFDYYDGYHTDQEMTITFASSSSGLSPEPTSGILLILGAAGLALRRKGRGDACKKISHDACIYGIMVSGHRVG